MTGHSNTDGDPSCDRIRGGMGISNFAAGPRVGGKATIRRPLSMVIILPTFPWIG
jgi:hypothetical protein